MADLSDGEVSAGKDEEALLPSKVSRDRLEIAIRLCKGQGHERVAIRHECFLRGRSGLVVTTRVRDDPPQPRRMLAADMLEPEGQTKQEAFELMEPNSVRPAGLHPRSEVSGDEGERLHPNEILHASSRGREQSTSTDASKQ